jgi:hypothetical protein
MGMGTGVSSGDAARRGAAIGASSHQLSALARWTPAAGPETRALLDHLGLPTLSQETLFQSSLDILARCVPPTAATGRETGLVIGYVQSGKTMSFTTVAALAHDNGYQMVIVITGISDPLFRQSTTRLQRDLRLETRRERRWVLLTNPSPRNADGRTIKDTLADWKDPAVPTWDRQTVLITVMKNHRHLKNLVSVLSKLDLRQVPSLVVDDEADQAGLNTLVRQGDESRTYQRLVSLRDCLPHHTFLQYTATPQAPLLINLIDVLSPDFAEILSPGPDYTGGQDFFIQNPRLIRRIPQHEISTRANHLDGPPDSLLSAMALFFIGVAVGLLRDGGMDNRSMLVHPSFTTAGHRQYFHWVTTVKDRWELILTQRQGEDNSKNNVDRHDLLTEFREAYDDLQVTAQDLPNFEAIAQTLPRAIRKTRVEEVNATRGQTPHIDWSAGYSHILVGGQAMDRGFTVEGLTVTYMPRGLGVGNADTVQQRARFFGYKRQYLGYCRVFLPADMADAYHNYVEHEEDIRGQLIGHRSAGKRLPEWKRVFFLHRDLRPTRHNVLHLDYMRSMLHDEWVAPRAPHDSNEAMEANRRVVSEFIKQLKWRVDEGHPLRTQTQRHAVASEVPLSFAYEHLLTLLRVTRPADSQRNTIVLLQLQAYLEEHQHAMCTIYRMTDGRPRVRQLDADDQVNQLFQGSNSHGDKLIYPGDREIRAPHGVTIQIHMLHLMDGDHVACKDVPVVAVFLPREVAKDLVIQDQGGPYSTP